MSEFMDEYRRARDAAAANPGAAIKDLSKSKGVRHLVVGVIAVVLVIYAARAMFGGALSSAQEEACRFDFGQAHFNIYGGSFNDYDFAKARLISASKVNRSADDFANYLYEIPARGAKQPITCGIYKKNGKWLSVTRNPW